MYVYIDTDGGRLYTVGFYTPVGAWVAESDYADRESAADRVHYLNGGSSQVARLAISQWKRI